METAATTLRKYASEILLGLIVVLAIAGYFKFSAQSQRLDVLVSENAALRSQLGDLKGEVAVIEKKPVSINTRIVREIRLTRLVLVDENDKPLFALERKGSHALQTFMEHDGTNRIVIGVTDDNRSRVRLLDHAGRPLVGMSAYGGADTSTASGFAVNSKFGQPLLVAGADEQNTTVQVINPATHTEAVRLQGSGTNFSGLITFRANGTPSVGVGGGSTDIDGLEAIDADGKVRVLLGTRTDRYSFLQQIASDGSLKFAADADAQGNYLTGPASPWATTSNVMTAWAILDKGVAFLRAIGGK